jgi:hypothetical protein
MLGQMEMDLWCALEQARIKMEAVDSYDRSNFLCTEVYQRGTRTIHLTRKSMIDSNFQQGFNNFQALLESLLCSSLLPSASIAVWVCI